MGEREGIMLGIVLPGTLVGIHSWYTSLVHPPGYTSHPPSQCSEVPHRGGETAHPRLDEQLQNEQLLTDDLPSWCVTDTRFTAGHSSTRFTVGEERGD